MKIRGFISYSHDDGSVLTNGLSSYLTNLLPNFEPIYDAHVTESNKIEEIKQKLTFCDILIVIITPASLKSKPITEEIELAKEKKMKILPCKDQYLGKDWKELPWDIEKYKGVEFENLDELKRKTYSALTKALEQLAKELQESIPEKNEAIKSEATQEELKEIEKAYKKFPWFKFSLDPKDDSFDIMASIVKGKINDIFVNKKALSLIVSIQTMDKGILKVVFPRKLLDAKSKKQDLPFFVLVDGEETEYDDIPSPKARALIIPLNKGANEVEILGTEVMGISYSGEIKRKNIVEIPSGASDPSNSQFFVPAHLEIHVGDKVRWENNDFTAHTITSGEPSVGPDGLFDSTLIYPSKSFEVTLNKTGTYRYFCLIHPWAKGTIIVSTPVV